MPMAATGYKKSSASGFPGENGAGNPSDEHGPFVRCGLEIFAFSL
jgi:hypothetical protein